MNKTIANVVFYKFWDPTREEPMEQACIFYTDGTVENTDYETGVDKAYELANVEKLTNVQFRSILNNERVFTLSGEEFERRFQEFVALSRQGIERAVRDGIDKVEATRRSERTDATGATPLRTPSKKRTGTPAGTTTSKDKTGTPAGTTTSKDKTGTPAGTTTSKDKTGTPAGTTTSKDKTGTPVGAATPTDKTGTPVGTTPTDKTDTSAGPTPPTRTETKAEKAAAKANKKKKVKDPNKKSLWQKFKESKIGKRVTALIVALAMVAGFGAGWHLNKAKMSGTIKNPSSITQLGTEAQDQAYLALINKTTNKEQKELMTNQSANLDMFNKDFAAHYVETGSTVKPALTWDEMSALTLAYNNLSKDQIKAMFNGAEVDSRAMSDAYKTANLQLMGAYVISTKDHPVNLENLVTSQEGKEFVEKYETLFYACKVATGQDRINAVNAFYQELSKDFPITDKVREEGLAHADGRKQVKDYMIAVTPMVSAAEIMWQNLSIDHTLSDKATAYFNDLGICNIATDAFERAETITLTAEVDTKNPTYFEFRDTKEEELIYEGNYGISDAEREISKLTAFQQWVNAGISFGPSTNTNANGGTHTQTQTGTKTETTVTKDRDEAVNKAGETAVKEAEKAADKDVAAENAAAKAEAERRAEEEAKRLQAEADAEAARLAAEQAAADKALQDAIDAANKVIEDGGKVNADDLGDDVTIYDEYKDENGNIDSSIGNIGTNSGSTPTGTSTTSGETTGFTSDGIYTYEVPYTNEQIVDAWIAEMEGQTVDSTSGKTYTK